jgi:hypothetical protein
MTKGAGMGSLGTQQAVQCSQSGLVLPVLQPAAGSDLYYWKEMHCKSGLLLFAAAPGTADELCQVHTGRVAARSLEFDSTGMHTADQRRARSCLAASVAVGVGQRGVLDAAAPAWTKPGTGCVRGDAALCGGPELLRMPTSTGMGSRGTQQVGQRSRRGLLLQVLQPAVDSAVCRWKDMHCSPKLLGSERASSTIIELLQMHASCTNVCRLRHRRDACTTSDRWGVLLSGTYTSGTTTVSCQTHASRSTEYRRRCGGGTLHAAMHVQHTTSIRAGICLTLIAALLRNTPQRTMSAIASPVLLRALIMAICAATATTTPCGTSAGDTAAAIAHGQQLYSWRSLLMLAATAIMTIKAHVASTARADHCACQHCQKSKACTTRRACSCSHCRTEKAKRRTREFSRRFHRKSDTSSECGCRHCKQQHRKRNRPAPRWIANANDTTKDCGKRPNSARRRLTTHTAAYKIRHAVARSRSTQLTAHRRHNRYSKLQAKHTAARVMDDVQHRKRCEGRNALYASLHAQASNGVPLHGMLRSRTRLNKKRRSTTKGHVSKSTPPQPRQRVLARTHATRQTDRVQDEQRSTRELPFEFAFKRHQEDTQAGACAISSTSTNTHEGSSPPRRANCSHEGECCPDHARSPRPTHTHTYGPSQPQRRHQEAFKTTTAATYLGAP